MLFMARKLAEMITEIGEGGKFPSREAVLKILVFPLLFWDKCSIHSKASVPGWEHSKSCYVFIGLVVDQLGIP